MAPNWTKWAGVAALLGGLLSLLLTIPFALAYFQAYPGYGVPPPWLLSFRRPLSTLLAFAPATVVYAIYGRLFGLVYLLFLPGVFGLHQVQQVRPGNAEQWSFRLLVSALVTTWLGVLSDYWANGAGFLLEVVGLLLLLLSTTLYGIVTLRTAVLPSWSAWPLILAGPAGCVTTLLLGHVPSGPTVTVAIAWMVVGYLLWRQPHTVQSIPGAR